MKSTHLILAIGWIALLPPSFVSAAKPTRHALPSPSAAREVNYEVIAGDEVHLGGRNLAGRMLRM